MYGANSYRQTILQVGSERLVVFARLTMTTYAQLAGLEQRYDCNDERGVCLRNEIR